jgi:nucleoside-specific outer membrane channel protein Tsx
MKLKKLSNAILMAGLSTFVFAVHAAEFSETSINTRYGNSFAEPGIPGDSIQKNIYGFTHISGDKFGRNLVVADVLLSDDKDPSVGKGSKGAQEFYGFYRRTLSLSKVSGTPMANGLIRDVNLVGRVDLQTKNIQFAPRARKLAAGVSVDFAVPMGFVESGVYAYSETNHNGIVGKDVSFDTTYQVDTSWMIPFNVGTPAQWRGTFSYTGAKGKDGFGAPTKAETRLFTSVMFEVGNKSGLSVGLGYELWRNKYGNNQSATPGAKQNTAQLIAEYKF